MSPTLEPEFVFYHNPVLGVVDSGYNPAGSFSRRLVSDCFRLLSLEQLRALRPGSIAFVDREVYDDSRVPEVRAMFGAGGLDNNDVLAAFMRVHVNRTEPDGLWYVTVGGCKGERMFDHYPESWYVEPDLVRIETLVKKYGDGIESRLLLRNMETALLDRRDQTKFSTLSHLQGDYCKCILVCIIMDFLESG
jgi:hypothetical protein